MQDSVCEHSSLLGPNNCREGNQSCSAALLGGKRAVMGKKRKVLFASSLSSAGADGPHQALLLPWGDKRKAAKHSKPKVNHTRNPNGTRDGITTWLCHDSTFISKIVVLLQNCCTCLYSGSAPSSSGAELRICRIHAPLYQAL